MGFVKANMVPILKECRERPFHGSLLCLGFPDIYFRMDQFRQMAFGTNTNLDDSVTLQLSSRKYFAKLGCISGESLFRSLGFQNVEILDYSQFEGADIMFDLNRSDLPSSLVNGYDVIIDHGTIEHVFHIPNTLNNIYKMLNVGGRIIHSSPSSNFVDHGFYMFSPTLFHDFYTANKFKINTIQVTQSSPRQDTDPCFYADYEPGSFSGVSYGGLNSSIFGIICIATKTEESTGHVIPQQGLYNKVWNQKGDGLSKRAGRYIFRKLFRSYRM
jgi:hypothetical protein